MIKPAGLQRVAFYDAHLPLEKIAPTIFDLFPNVSEFTVAFTTDTLFRRRTEAGTSLKKPSKKYKLNHLWLQLRDDGFETATNRTIAKQLIKKSPYLTQLFVESMATIAHEDIIELWSAGQCPNLQVIVMTHYERICQLRAHPIVNEITNGNSNNKSSLKKTVKQQIQGQKGLRVLAITENHISYHHYDYVKIKGDIIIKVHATLELLFFENVYPSSHATWPELFTCCTKDIWFPRLRHVILHLGKICNLRRASLASLIEKDFENKLCILLSCAPRLENFTYRRDLIQTRHLEAQTWITDTLLQTLIEHCTVLTTFRVAGCYRFSSNMLRQFIQAFEGQLKTVEFDCSIRSDNLRFVVKTIKCLEKISIRHICPQRHHFHNCPNIQGTEGTDILTTWGGSSDITPLQDISRTLYDIF